MVSPDKKKKAGVILFFAAFVVIVIIMIVAGYKSKLVYEFPSPQDGVDQLVTLDDKLIAISKSNEIYVWAWGNLPAVDKAGTINAERIAAVEGNHFISADSKKSILVTTTLDDDKHLQKIFLPIGKRCENLKASLNGKHAVFVLVSSRGSDNNFQMAVTDSNLGYLSKVVTKERAGDFVLNDIGISNDGKYIVAAGKNETGWILVADTEKKEVIWEKNLKDSAQLGTVVFSPDSQMIYASISESGVGVFETASGNHIGNFEMDKYKTPPNNPQEISCITVSPDGHLLAVASVPASRIWLCDAKTGERIDTISPSQFTVTALAFSPDLSLLASGDLIGKVQMKVWNISAAK